MSGVTLYFHYYFHSKGATQTTRLLYYSLKALLHTNGSLYESCVESVFLRKSHKTFQLRLQIKESNSFDFFSNKSLHFDKRCLQPKFYWSQSTCWWQRKIEREERACSSLNWQTITTSWTGSLLKKKHLLYKFDFWNLHDDARFTEFQP